MTLAISSSRDQLPNPLTENRSGCKKGLRQCLPHLRIPWFSRKKPDLETTLSQLQGAIRNRSANISVQDQNTLVNESEIIRKNLLAAFTTKKPSQIRAAVLEANKMTASLKGSHSNNLPIDKKSENGVTPVDDHVFIVPTDGRVLASGTSFQSVVSTTDSSAGSLSDLTVCSDVQYGYTAEEIIENFNQFLIGKPAPEGRKMALPDPSDQANNIYDKKYRQALFLEKYKANGMARFVESTRENPDKHLEKILFHRMLRDLAEETYFEKCDGGNYKSRVNYIKGVLAEFVGKVAPPLDSLELGVIYKTLEEKYNPETVTNNEYMNKEQYEAQIKIFKNIAKELIEFCTYMRFDLSVVLSDNSRLI
jgi:hypothetical protein